jgi:hypothetical protein
VGFWSSETVCEGFCCGKVENGVLGWGFRISWVVVEYGWELRVFCGMSVGFSTTGVGFLVTITGLGFTEVWRLGFGVVEKGVEKVVEGWVLLWDGVVEK